MNKKIVEKVKEIIAEMLDIESTEIELEDNVIDDLGADSIAVMEIVMELEEEYDFEVPTDDVLKLVTVEDIVTYIEDNQ